MVPRDGDRLAPRVAGRRRVGAETAAATRDGAEAGLTTWAVSNVSAVSVVGLLTYGFLRFANQLFYGRLGAKPEDVGLGYTETLSQSVTLAVLVLGVAVLLLLLWVNVRLWRLNVRLWMRLASDVFTDMRRNPRHLWAYLAFLAVGTVVITVLVRLPNWVSWSVVVVMLAIGIPGAVRKGRRRSQSAPEHPLQSGAYKATYRSRTTYAPRNVVSETSRGLARPTVVRLIGTWAALVGLALALVLAIVVQDAETIRNGRSLPRTGVWGSISPWTGERADVRWVGGSQPSGFDPSSWDCLMFLGQSDGTAVFYDARAHRSLRIPAGSVFVTITGEATPCR